MEEIKNIIKDMIRKVEEFNMDDKIMITDEKKLARIKELAEKIKLKPLQNLNFPYPYSDEELMEMEYHVQSQLDSIARFKKRHPNGAKIDLGDKNE